MSYFDPQLIFYPAVFVATMLLVQGTATSTSSDKNGVSKRVNARMKLIASRRQQRRGAVGAAPRRAARRGRCSRRRSIVEYLEVRLTQAGIKMPVERLIVLMLDRDAGRRRSSSR